MKKSMIKRLSAVILAAIVAVSIVPVMESLSARAMGLVVAKAAEEKSSDIVEDDVSQSLDSESVLSNNNGTDILDENDSTQLNTEDSEVEEGDNYDYDSSNSKEEMVENRVSESAPEETDQDHIITESNGDLVTEDLSDEETQEDSVEFAGGDGTEDNPYEIETKSQLAAIQYNLSANYCLKNDIVFAPEDFEQGGEFYNDGRGWIPIGDGFFAVTIKNENEFNEFRDRYGRLYYKMDLACNINTYDDIYSTYYYFEEFKGVFNGNGHVIKNLTILNNNPTYKKYFGLFGYAYNATISNLGVENCDIQLTNAGWYYGAIAGVGNIYNCYSSGYINVSAKNVHVGGLLGQGNASNSYNTTRIHVSSSWPGSEVGGIVGFGSAENCFNNGYVTVGSSYIQYVGGIAGAITSAIDCCYSIGYSDPALVGYDYGENVSIRHSYYSNSVSDYVGGYCSSSTQVESLYFDQMKEQESFEWFDFENVWQIGANENYPYPELKGVKNIITDLSTCDIELLPSVTKYGDYLPSVTISKDGNIYNKRDYLIKYYMDGTLFDGQRANKMGTVKLQVTGIGRLTGTQELEFEVAPYDLENAKVEVNYYDDVYLYYNNYSVRYDGTQKTLPPLKLVNENNYEIPSDNYKIEYSNNINAGVATAKIVGDSQAVVGEKILEFNITKSYITDIPWETYFPYTYDGKEHDLYFDNPHNIKMMYSVNGSDYSESLPKGTNVGEYVVDYYCIDPNYEYFEESATFMIYPRSLWSEETKITGLGKYTYTGKPITPEPKVTVNGVLLRKGIDYTVSYENNIYPGNATVMISGIGNYESGNQAYFEISPITGWKKEGGYWYYYDDYGYKVTNVWKKGSKGWCYLGSDGKLVTNGWAENILINSEGYRYNSTGWIKYNGYWYYLVKGCRVYDTWKKDSKGWCYLGSDGRMVANGWAVDSRGQVWMNGSGYWDNSTKWIKYNGGWYYIDKGYRIGNTWKKDSKGWCFLGDDGRMVTNGWAKDSKGWCWMGPNGYWVKNKWINYKGEWYYIKSNGYMAANEWAKDSKGWMYMASNGKVTKNKWVKSGGYWYYLKSNGYMATGALTIGGKNYKFDSSGRWVS